MRGALESGKSITILDGIDMMQKESANAMLKTLEEPPLGTIMILLTDRIHAVLPTIVSRCQLLRFSFLPPEIIRAQLSTRFNIPLDDKRLDDIIHTGSLGQSIHLFENPDEEISKDAAEFLRLCIDQDWSLIAPKIDHLSAIDNYSMYEKLFTRIIHFVRNAFLGNLGGTENYIMGDRSLTAELKNINTPDKANDVVALCEKAIGQIRARANISLVFVNYAIAVMEIFNGEK
jgi:DNA polymerase-3 subunit delta'